MDAERQPVIVGVGRFTQRPKPVEECLTPVGMFEEAATRAAIDAGVGPELLKDLVGVASPAMFLEMRWRGAYSTGPIMETGYYKNFCMSVANKLGANPDPKFTWRSEHGGNGPCFLTATYAETVSYTHLTLPTKA